MKCIRGARLPSFVICCDVMCRAIGLASVVQAGRARALYKAGLRSAQAVAETSSREIAKIIASWGRNNLGACGCILSLRHGRSAQNAAPAVSEN